MNKRFWCILILLAVYTPGSKAQELSLISYIDSVLQKNPDIVRAGYQREKAAIDKRQSIWNFTPEINAQLNVNKIYGTAFDNVTFQRIQKATTNVFPSLNLNMTLFDGFINILRARYAQYNQHVADYQLDIRKTEQVTESVRLYCQYLVNQQTTLLYLRRQEALDKLQAQKKIELETGAVSQAGYLAVSSQYETETANYLDAKNKEKISLRDLYAFVRQKADTAKKVSAVLPEPDALRARIASLQLNYPELRNKRRREEQLMFSNLRWQSISSFSPKVYLNASLSSSYSSNGIIDYNTGTISYPNYTTQFRLNQYQFVGLTFSVPIFQRMSRVFQYQKTQIDRKDMQVKNEQEDLVDNNTHMLLTESITVLEQRHKLLTTSAEASTIAFREQEMKFKEGHIDFYTYMNAMNTRDANQLELLKNKVEYLVTAVQLGFWEK